MPYDVPLVLSFVAFFFSVLGIMSALMEKHSPIRHALTMLVAGGLFYYAWSLSEGQIDMQAVSEAFMRIISKIS